MNAVLDSACATGARALCVETARSCQLSRKLAGRRKRGIWRVSVGVRLLGLTLMTASVCAVADDSGLALPTLIAVDSDLGAAVVRSDTGNLITVRRGETISPGRWKLDSVAASAVVLVVAGVDDPEAGTQVRLDLGAPDSSPLIIRDRAPDLPMAPRLVLQIGVRKPIEAHSSDTSRDHQ